MTQDENNDAQNGEYFPPGVPTPPPPTAQQYYGTSQPFGYQQQNEPNATMALVFGILGLALCQFLAPVGWIMGAKSRKKIKESNGTLGGDGLALAGMVCGIIGTVLLVFSVLYVVFVFVIIAGAGLN